MTAIVNSPRFLKHRRFLLILPLLMLPFLILLFVILGGGKGSMINSFTQHAGNLNVKLPDAHFKKGADKSKLSLYEEASRDSALLKEKIKNDPYYLLEPHDSLTTETPKRLAIDQNERKVMDKLAQLKAVLQKKDQESESNVPDLNSERQAGQTGQFGKMMADLNNSKPHNAEIDQLNSMLNKIMAIQHPEMIQDSLNRLAENRKASAYHVTVNQSVLDAETFGSENGDHVDKQPVVNRFYDLVGETSIENATENAVEAIIPETQVLVSGSAVKLRLLNDIRINGHLIPRDQFVYGTASLSNERLKIQFSSIRSGNNILPVSLEAYDLDGLAGIFIPGSINRDVAKQSGDQAMNAIGLSSLDPSIGAQAASAGIQAAKTLVSRKVKLIKVTVKAGYRIMLKDTK